MRSSHNQFIGKESEDEGQNTGEYQYLRSELRERLRE